MSKAKNNTSKTLVLLDSHAIIHRAYHALPEFLSSSGEPTGALYGLSSMLMKIISDLKPDYIVACYDLPQKTFRHLAYDAYKAGRAKTDDALIVQLKNSRQIFEAFNIPIYDASGFEADDVIGTIVEKCKKFKIENCELKIIIASGDMDTMQLVDDKKVQVYTLKKGITDTILYDEEKMIERFHFKPSLLPDYKGLRGDASDNIKGIKGIGEKTAENLIANFGTIEEIYKKIKKDEKIFIKAGISPRMVELIKHNEEEALFSKTLATIRTDAPVDFKIPEKTFWQNADIKKIEKTFTLFEFRSLFMRLKSFFNGDNTEKEEKIDIKVDSIKLQEASIALWLINSDISNPQLDDILLFSHTDSFDKAYEYIFKELKEKNLEKVYEEIERPIMHIVKEMEDHGILLDKKYFEKLGKEYHAELDKLTAKIYKMAGTEFNINSPKQMGEVLFGKMGMKSKKKGASGAFSTKGYKLYAFDYSQIELRVAAMLSGDKKMTQIFRDKKDVHTGVASFVFGVPMDKVDGEMRRRAKVINFGIIYGMGVSALRKNLVRPKSDSDTRSEEVTREEAQKFYDNYFTQFSGIREYLESVKKFALEHTYTETLFGRRRYFPNINSRIPFLKNMAERTATNAPIQGTAADIIKLAIRYAEEDLDKAGLLSQVHLMLQIHDELVYEIEESALEKADKIIKQAMQNVLERS